MPRNKETRGPTGWLRQEFQRQSGEQGRWVEGLAGRRQTGLTAHQECACGILHVWRWLAARDDSSGLSLTWYLISICYKVK